MFRDFFRSTWKILVHETLWVQFPETEGFRSGLCRFLVRSASVVRQLVLTQTTAYPFKLLGLLTQDVAARRAMAREILDGPKCLWCNFTHQFLSKYSDVEKLVSQPAMESLEAIGRLGHGTTYVVERLHSTNQRRTASRAATHRATPEYLDLHLTAHAGAPALAPQPLRKKQQKHSQEQPAVNPF